MTRSKAGHSLPCPSLTVGATSRLPRPRGIVTKHVAEVAIIQHPLAPAAAAAAASLPASLATSCATGLAAPLAAPLAAASLAAPVIGTNRRSHRRSQHVVGWFEPKRHLLRLLGQVDEHTELTSEWLAALVRSAAMGRGGGWGVQLLIVSNGLIACTVFKQVFPLPGLTITIMGLN